jgi:DNA topoisomerase I
MGEKKKSTLIITEKPQAAAKIAAALSGAKDEKITTKDKVSYYNFQRGGKDYLVGCAVGHLYGIQQNEARGPFPNFDVSWKPAFTKKRSAFTKKYLSVLKKLAKESDEFIVATDFDTEGEVIGWNVARFVCKQKDAKRMKFSTLTKDELEESFNNLLPTLNWGAAIAGETRHFIDWYYGINLSRGLMKAISSLGRFKLMSIGRVQGPALNLLVEKEKEIKAFEPLPFWQVFLQIKDIRGQKLEVKYPKDIFDEKELLRFKFLEGKTGNAVTTIKETEVAPPAPFDLTTLQTESYKNFGLTPSRTLQVAQQLYLAGVISYPRTSSQKYPKAIGYDKILKLLKKYTTKTKYAVNKIPTEGKKEDPAHPAIYPTGEQKKLGDVEKKVYDLIVKRFISCFAKPALIDSKNVKVEVGGMKFTNNGKIIKEKNWLAVYPSKIEEKEVPTINGEVDITEIRTEQKETSPPRRYSAASLVKELEKRNLGTKATRASIVETLSNRDYVKGKALEVTSLGMNLHEALEKHSPIIIDEELTSKMAKELENIESSTENLEKLENKILEQAKKDVKKIAADVSSHLKEIGEALIKGNDEVIEEKIEESTFNFKCPNCKKGDLQVRYGRKFKRYFVACNNYPECKTTFSLPPTNSVKPTRDKDGNHEICDECSFPKVAIFKRGKAPWRLCFNPKCPSNEESEKKKAEFKERLAKGELKVVGGKVIEIDPKTKKKKVTKKKKKKKKKKKAVKKKV